MQSLAKVCPLALVFAALGCSSSEVDSSDSQVVGGAASIGGSGGQTAAPGGTSSAEAGGSPTSTGTDTSVSTGGRTATSGEPSGGTSSTVSEPSGGTPSAGGAPSTGSTTPTTTTKFVGNITTDGGQVDIGSLKYKEFWNQVSPQNEGKWGSVSRAAGQYNWSALDTLYKYSKDNNIIFKQHTFVWGAQQPTYNITEADVKDWMNQFCKRYPDVAIIDVVNEPPPHTTPSYANAIGGGTNGNWAWITNAFKWAREACPKAILVLNDYNNLEWDTDNKHFIDIVNTVKSNGGPIDAIGCQAHDLDHTNSSGALDVDVAGVTRRLNALIAADPEIYITELDLSTKDDAVQLKLYQDFWPLFWNSPNVKGITLWGWVVGRTWSLAPDSGLITSSGTKRPAFTWLLQQIGKG